jgi:hypothetical protein
MFAKISRFALATLLGAVVVGCSNKSDSSTAANSDSPTTKPSATAVAAEGNRPGINATPGTPSGPDNKAPAPAKTDTSSAQVTPGPAVPDRPAPTNGVNPPATTEATVNPLFTLPPSKGPAAHKFKQLTLDRSGPSGALEMQLTGDGIYRIRDHGRGNSYAGDGKLTDEQINTWAAAMKDWESLKEDYRSDPKSTEGDKIEIYYGGKRVVINTADKDNPKIVTDAYKRLLDLNEQSKKENGSAAETPAAPAPTPAPGPATETPKKEDVKPAVEKAIEGEIKKDAKEIEKKVESVQPEKIPAEKPAAPEIQKKEDLKPENEKEKAAVKEEIKKAAAEIEKKVEEVQPEKTTEKKEGDPK